jgi:hypothetical protein
VSWDVFERVINSCLVFEFGKRTGRIETLTNSDLDMVREAVFVGVDADSELVSNGIAVDCVEQRVQFIGGDFVSIDVAGVRYVLEAPLLSWNSQTSQVVTTGSRRFQILGTQQALSVTTASVQLPP